MRRIFSIGLLALGLAACSKEGPQSGPVVAKGKGFEITSGEFKARIEEQSPFMRARYNNLDRKKEFLDSLVRFEVLAAEAKRQGLDKDADVQLMVKRFMVNKLVQKNMSDQGKDPATVVPDAEAQKYYDDHISEYQRPKRVHLALVVFNSEPGTPKRTKDLASAKRALAQLKVDEKKTPMAFNGIVNTYSEDPNKAQGGDLGFKSADELTQAFSPALASTAMELGNGQTSSAIETPKGVYLLRNLGQQDAMNRGFDQVKSQIVAKLARDKHQKEFEEWLKKLKDDAGVQTNDKDLDAIVISTGLPQAPGMPGMQPGMPPGHPGMPGMQPGMPPGHPGMPGQPGMPVGHPPMMPNPQGPMSAPASK